MKIEVVLIFVLLACSCTPKTHNPKTGNIQKIDVLSKPDSIISNLSDIASEIQYVPLKTLGISGYPYIYKILSLVDKTYINFGFNLLCYDDSGKFLFSLFKNFDESPGFIEDFDISQDQKTVALLYYKKILLFENRDGKPVFTKSIMLKDPSPCKISFIPETNNILLSITPRKGTEKYLSLLINKDGDTLQLRRNHTLYILPSMPISETQTIQYRSGNTVFFKEQNNDTIFCINKKSDIAPSFILDLNGKTLLNWVKGSGEYKYQRMNPYLVIENIHEVPKFILYTYSRHWPNASYTLNYRIVYNKVTGKKLLVNINKELKDDLFGGPDYYPKFVSRDRYYSWTYNSDLKKYTDSEVFEKTNIQNSARKDFLKNLSDSLRDRDIILIVALPK